MFGANPNNTSGFDIGEPMVDLDGRVTSFDYEGYHFEPFEDGEAWQVTPTITE